MERKTLALIGCLLFMIVGCTVPQNYVAKHSLTGPDEVSIPFPENEPVVTFDAVLNPGLLPEFTVFEKDGKIQTNGIWALVAEDSKFNGICWYNRMTAWLELQAKCMVKGALDMVKDIPYLISSSDGGFLFDLKGKQVKVEESAESPLTHNPKSFDEIPDYRGNVFRQYGKSIAFMERHWLDKLAQEGVNEKLTIALEARVGNSAAYQQLLSDFASVMPITYAMEDGRLRASFLDLNRFSDRAVELSDSKYLNRVFKDTKVNLTLLAALAMGTVSPPMLILAGVGQANGFVSALQRDNIQGNKLRARNHYYNLMKVMEWYETECQAVNLEKIKIIKAKNAKNKFVKVKGDRQ